MPNPRKLSSLAALSLGVAAALATVPATAQAAPRAATPTTGTLASYSGATSGNALQVALDLPQAVAGLPNPAALGLISVSGTALDETASAATDHAKAFAGLGSGSLVTGPAAPLAALGQSLTVRSGQQTSTLDSVPANPIGVTGALGNLVADVPSGLPASDATANLASLSMGSLQAILPAAAVQAIQSAYNTIEPQAQPVLTQAVNQVDSVLGPLASADPTGTAASVQTAVNQLAGQLSCSGNANCLLNTVLGAPLLQLKGVDASQHIQQVSGGVQAVAHSSLISLNLLDGLVTVNGFTSDASAFADGIAGQATAKGNTIIANELVDHGVIGVDLGDNGSVLGVTVGGLSNSVVSQINTALTQIVSTINGLLSSLGVRVTPSQGTDSVNPNGTSATASGAVLDVSVMSPTAAPQSAPLVDVLFGGTHAQANAAQAVSTAKVVDIVNLPHTGANLTLIGMIAFGLLAGAYLIRRRLAR